MTASAESRAILLDSTLTMGGADVVYARGADSVSLVAATLQPAFGTMLSGGASLDIERREYLLAVADLVLDGAAAEPQRGDKITETIAGQSVTFEVMDDGQDGAWKFEDPAHAYYRVFCKRQATAGS